MKKIIALIYTGAIASAAFAQTVPPVTPVVGATPTPAAAPATRPARVLTPEQQAAADKDAAQKKADYQDMLAKLNITQPLRRGPGGSTANYDESKANPYPNLPDPLTFKDGKKVKTAADWTKRRKEIVEDMDREIYGRMPKNTPKVTWTVASTTNEKVGDIDVITKKLVGHVDNSSYPAVKVDLDLTLTTPANAKGPVPVMMVLGPGGGGFGPPPAARPTAAPATGAASVMGAPAVSAAAAGRPGGFGAGGPRPPGAKELLIQKGWGYASLNTSSIQEDNGQGLTRGIIGLMNKGQFRKPDDWGALRAWAWGADRAMDYFENDKAVNAKEVGVEGHSRWGKGTIVTMAYDPRFAIAYVSSSGEGGAKLNRRYSGEQVENVAGDNEYHWMAGNFIKYAGPLNEGDMPVDSHELIAMCAPRPVFISAGISGTTVGNNDSWVDAPGSFMAADAAGPVYTLLGKQAMQVHTFPPRETLVDGDIAFRQHNSGHTDGPNWPYFLTFADKYFK